MREVKRGEIWTVSGGKDYAGKPRPVVILQDDRFDMTEGVMAGWWKSLPMNYGRDRSSWARNQSTKHSSFCMSLLSEVLGSTCDEVF